MTTRERQTWIARHDATTVIAPPSPFVVAALARLGPPAPGARALDLACGRGRHALLLARHGYRVEAVDYAPPALAVLSRAARAAGLPVAGVAADVLTWPVPQERYALVLVVSFLARALHEALRRAVAPGGVLLMETFLEGQERYGHPTSATYLLAPGELAALCNGWEVLDAHEGCTERDGRPTMLAGVLARKSVG
jgi:tellurite methyltransferase